MRADDARPTSMSHYYHIGTSRVVTTPHGERTTTVTCIAEEREEIGLRERERERVGRGAGGRGGEEDREEKSSSILVTNRFDMFLPPFVSNAAYPRWTTV